VVIYDTYLLIILLIWLLKSVYLSNTYFYEHYAARTETAFFQGPQRGNVTHIRRIFFPIPDDDFQISWLPEDDDQLVKNAAGGRTLGISYESSILILQWQ